MSTRAEATDRRVSGSNCQPVSKKSAAGRLFLKNTEQTLLLWCFFVPNSCIPAKRKRKTTADWNTRLFVELNMMSTLRLAAHFRTRPQTTSHCMFLICFSCTNSKKWQVRFHQLHSHIRLQKTTNFCWFGSFFLSLLLVSVYSATKCIPATNFQRSYLRHALFPCTLTAAVHSKHPRVSHPAIWPCVSPP